MKAAELTAMRKESFEKWWMTCAYVPATPRDIAEEAWDQAWNMGAENVIKEIKKAFAK